MSSAPKTLMTAKHAFEISDRKLRHAEQAFEFAYRLRKAGKEMANRIFSPYMDADVRDLEAAWEAAGGARLDALAARAEARVQRRIRKALAVVPEQALIAAGWQLRDGAWVK